MITEDVSGDESDDKNLCEGLDQGSANSDKIQLTWKLIFSDGSDSGSDIDVLEQTDSASCQLVSSGSGSNDTSPEHKRRVMVTCWGPEKNLKRSSATD